MHVDWSVEIGPDAPALEVPWQSSDGALRYIDLKRHPESVAEISEALDLPELKALLLRVNAADFPLQTVKCDCWSTQEMSPEEQIFGASCKFSSYIDLTFVDPKRQLSFAEHESLVKRLTGLLNRAPDIAASIEFVVRRCYFHSLNSDHGHLHAARCPAKHYDFDDTLRAAITQAGPLSSNIAAENKAGSFSSNLAAGNKAGSLSSNFAAGNKAGPLSSNLAEGNKAGPLAEMTGDGFSVSAYTSGFGSNEAEAKKSWSIVLAVLQYALVQESTGLDRHGPPRGPNMNTEFPK